MSRAFSHYEIKGPLGKGGMGEVFRAHDTKLGRDVALKILPEAFAQDAQRMGRFSREAKMLAALNHPNVAVVHGLEEDGDRRALIMELVEGETLQDRIARGAVPLAEAARIGLELAQAIEVAHEKGIVHRDLKPANVMLDSEGRVKVLDFGLAKAMEEEKTADELANSPTLSLAATQAGIILGTAAYMSPEQASGSNTDRRADIWSYGVVMFEVLSGRQQFSGETVSHTLAAVLKDDPDWGSLPPEVPSRIMAMLRRCLHKDPKQRLQAVGEARVMWEEYLSDPTSFTPAALGSVAASTTGPARFVPWGVALVAMAGLALVLWGRGSDQSTHQMTRRLSIHVTGVTNFTENQSTPAVVSPDGRYVAYGMIDDEGIDQLRLQPLEDFEARPLEGTQGARFPFWSPDSRHLGFFLNGKLVRVEIATGRVQTIGAERAFQARGGTWSTTGQVLFAPDANTGIWAIDAAGGEPRQITTPDPNVPDSSHRWPHALPDGEHFFYLMWTNDVESMAEVGGLYLARIDGTMEPRRVLPDPSSAQYVAPGYLMLMQERNLVAMPFDLERLEVAGNAFVVTDGVFLNRNQGHASFSASVEGTLVFAQAAESSRTVSFVWADRDGQLSDTPVEPGPIFDHLRLSPDGTRAVTTIPGATGDPGIWILDLIRGVRTRLTPPVPWSIDDGVWSPDGREILYVSAENGTWDLYLRNADGSGDARLLLGTEHDKVSADWVGDQIVYWSEEAVRLAAQIKILDTTTGESELAFEHEYMQPRPTFSPDARYLVHDGTASGRTEVFVYSIADGAKWQVSTSGGRFGSWKNDGTEIVYLDPERRVMSVEVTQGSGGLTFGTPVELFQIAQDVAAWDPAGDHSRFLLATRPQMASEPIRVILNWDARQ